MIERINKIRLSLFKGISCSLILIVLVFLSCKKHIDKSGNVLPNKKKDTSHVKTSKSHHSKKTAAFQHTK